jgi:hypothetical protein
MEDCYDSIVHPQKRIEIKKVLEMLMSRIVELKHRLVQWNPPNPDVRPEAFPWEYINFDEILVDLKLPPDTLDIRVPRYFREDGEKKRKHRDSTVKALMNLHHGVDSIPHSGGADERERQEGEEMSVEEAIGIIQRNERGRFGRIRGMRFLEYKTAQDSMKITGLSQLVSKSKALDQDEAGNTLSDTYFSSCFYCMCVYYQRKFLTN